MIFVSLNPTLQFPEYANQMLQSALASAPDHLAIGLIRAQGIVSWGSTGADAKALFCACQSSVSRGFLKRHQQNPIICEVKPSPRPWTRDKQRSKARSACGLQTRGVLVRAQYIGQLIWTAMGREVTKMLAGSLVGANKRSKIFITLNKG